MTTYAKGTAVSVDRSMNEVRGLLMKNKAEAVAIVESQDAFQVQFVFDGHAYKFPIKYPNPQDPTIRLNHKGWIKSEAQIQKSIDDEKRRLWRAMVLYIKAALEAHQNGLVNIKRSLMANMVTYSGKTIYQSLESNLDKAKTNPNFLLE